MLFCGVLLAYLVFYSYFCLCIVIQNCLLFCLLFEAVVPVVLYSWEKHTYSIEVLHCSAPIYCSIVVNSCNSYTRFHLFSINPLSSIRSIVLCSPTALLCSIYCSIHCSIHCSAYCPPYCPVMSMGGLGWHGNYFCPASLHQWMFPRFFFCGSQQPTVLQQHMHTDETKIVLLHKYNTVFCYSK